MRSRSARIVHTSFRPGLPFRHLPRLPVWPRTLAAPASTCPTTVQPGRTCIPGGTNVSNVIPAGSDGINLVGLRKYSSPNCLPLAGSAAVNTTCPPDGVPVFSNIFAEGTIANSNYNGLQISVERSYSHGLLFQASYTFSKAIDQGASFENELNPINFNATRGDFRCSTRRTASSSVRFGICQFPSTKASRGKLRTAGACRRLSPIRSGFPIRTQNCGRFRVDEQFLSSKTPTRRRLRRKVQVRRTPKTNNRSHWFTPVEYLRSQPRNVWQHAARAVLRARDQQYRPGHIEEHANQ